MFELLVRLNPKSAPMMRMDGVSELTSADIAAACAGANKFGVDIILAKIAGKSTKDLDARLYGMVVDLIAKEKWKMRGKSKRIEALLDLIIAEHINETRCASCHGTRYILAKRCTECNATGYIRFNDSLRAQLLGVDKSTFCKVWKERYFRILEVLSANEYDSYYHIRRLLK